ncbi:GATA transcription factor 8-like [Ananas comosus]|uniref:GATA transcription factor 8-like n=1 Tax=Ananas comosus TaxID=4615 RepID=A0A6P5HTF5_ANACO|nr:GATA transcription factor 8-like [Ananas comosus]XP_020115304.1 GATA transcription factor 8-like [Ananas comosus]
MEDVMAEISLDATCGDLFDHIDDLLEFPSEDDVFLEMDPPARNSSCIVSPAVLEPFLPPPLQNHTLLGGESGDKLDHNCGATTESNSEEEKLVTGNEDLDVAQLEWLSNFFDETTDSFTLDLPNFSSKAANNIDSNNTANAETAANEADCFFRTSSPVSVLEHSSSLNGGSGGGGSASSYSSSSSSSNSSSGSGSRSSSSSSGSSARDPEPVLVIPARARSKRARPAPFSGRPHVTIPFLAPPCDASCNGEGIAESSAPPPPPSMKKKKKIKKVGSSLTDAAAAAAAAAEEGYPQLQQQQQQAPAPVRKCMHCEIQKTPQWRAGPMGPKTLCNACGVRYKSGRLYPEYRPAASPTFVPSVHSNSHKKVVEMRLKAKTTGGGALPSSDLGRDLLDYIRRRE